MSHSVNPGVVVGFGCSVACGGIIVAGFFRGDAWLSLAAVGVLGIFVVLLRRIVLRSVERAHRIGFNEGVHHALEMERRRAEHAAAEVRLARDARRCTRRSFFVVPGGKA